MGRYVDEARAAGAEPILVTSMTRRYFGSDGRIRSNLVAYVDAVKKLAKEKKVALVDLHARSIELLDRLGPEESKAFQPAPNPNATRAAESRPAVADATHLSPKGAEVMGKIVVEELKKVEPRLAAYFK
jgi:lysophospholipase L1-like esterase